MHKWITDRWPLALNGGRVSYPLFRDHVEAQLATNCVITDVFSHVAVLVTDVKDTLSRLAETVDPKWADAEPVWGDAYGCHIARHTDSGMELELIQPVRESFFLKSLQEEGETAQHIAFNVSDISESLSRLAEAGAATGNETILDGLHGRTVFIAPDRLAPIFVELCQP